jgi:hypothetical protein
VSGCANARVLALPVAPAPVHAGLRELGVGHHLGQSVTGQFLRDVALGDVLLKPGEDHLEGARRVAKQRRVGHAARVQRVEHDARALVVAAMQLAAGDHVAQLAVLVRLARP